MATLKRFTLFPRLPKELQLMIWELCLPPPNIINIHRFAPEERDYGVYPRLVPSYKIPSILSVCKASREIGLQTYEIAFQQNIWDPLEHCGGVYIDFTRDALCFSDDEVACGFFRPLILKWWDKFCKVPWQEPDFRLRTVLIDVCAGFTYCTVTAALYVEMGEPEEIIYIRRAHKFCEDDNENAARRTYNTLRDFASTTYLSYPDIIPEIQDDGGALPKDDKRRVLIATSTMKNAMTYLGITKP